MRAASAGIELLAQSGIVAGDEPLAARVVREGEGALVDVTLLEVDEPIFGRSDEAMLVLPTTPVYPDDELGVGLVGGLAGAFERLLHVEVRELLAGVDDVHEELLLSRVFRILN